MKVLSKEQIAQIWELQKALDERIRKEKGISDEQDLSLEKYLALKTEFFEFVNELESFKYWKENKGKEHILEEACDTLHFVFSIAIDNDVEFELESLVPTESTLDDFHMNDILGVIDANITDCYIEREWSSLNAIIILMLIALEKSGFNADDLFNAYISKNKVNHERQDNNY